LSRIEKYGEPVFAKLSERFHKKVYEESEAWFRDIFKSSPRDVAARNFQEYLIQRFGGACSYTDRRGNTSIMNRHSNFNISRPVAERWLEIMEETLDEMEEFDEESNEKMMHFFRFMAYTLVVNAEALFEASRCSGMFSHLQE